MKISCTGVILAGGLSTRFSGKNKAFLNIEGKRILDYTLDIFKQLFDETILVTNNPLEFLKYDLKIVTDIYPVRSSLTGVHAGLFYSLNPYAFITACDTPFLQKALIETILNHIERRSDVIIPETSAGLEPLCAVYSKQCLKQIEMNISEEKFQIFRFFKKVRAKKIPEKTLRKVDPDLISFMNINTPDDLANAEKIVMNNKI